MQLKHHSDIVSDDLEKIEDPFFACQKVRSCFINPADWVRGTDQILSGLGFDRRQYTSSALLEHVIRLIENGEWFLVHGVSGKPISPAVMPELEGRSQDGVNIAENRSALFRASIQGVLNRINSKIVGFAGDSGGGSNANEQSSDKPAKSSKAAKARSENVVSEKQADDKEGKVSRTAAEDRAEISRLSKAGKIDEARAILKPYIPKAPSSNWDAFIERLDVDTPKDGAVFWSGDQKAAQRYAESIGGLTLEGTPGGNVINGWDELNKLPWGEEAGPPPWSGDLWNGVSTKFASGATGKVSVVQPPNKLWDQGTVWHNTEKEIIVDSLLEGTVTEVDILTLNSSGSHVQLSPNYVKDLINLEGIPR